MSRRRPLNETAPPARAAKARRQARARPKPNEPNRGRKTPAAKNQSTRRFGRLAKIIVTTGLVVATALVGGDWTLHQSFLRVQHVHVLGLRHEQLVAVLAASGLESQPAMIDVSASSIDQRLSAFAWIQSVSVTKHWPNTLFVSVRERAAVAVAFDSQHVLRYVDDLGHDLGPAPRQANLPTLVYLDATKPTWPYLRAGRAAAFVASRLPRAFAAQVSQITEDAQGIVALKLTTPVSFILGPPTNLTAKFVSIASVIAHATLQAGDVVDASVPGALAVTGPALK